MLTFFVRLTRPSRRLLVFSGTNDSDARSFSDISGLSWLFFFSVHLFIGFNLSPFADEQVNREEEKPRKSRNVRDGFCIRIVCPTENQKSSERTR
jgi:hypothetical protein